MAVGSLSPSSSSNSASPGKRCLNQPSGYFLIFARTFFECKVGEIILGSSIPYTSLPHLLQICWPNVWLQPGLFQRLLTEVFIFANHGPSWCIGGTKSPPRVRGDYFFRHPLPVLFYWCLWEHGGKMAASRIWKLRHIFFNWWFNDLAHWSVGLAIVLLIEFKLSKRQLWHCGCWGECLGWHQRHLARWKKFQRLETQWSRLISRMRRGSCLVSQFEVPRVSIYSTGLNGPHQQKTQDFR